MKQVFLAIIIALMTVGLYGQQPNLAPAEGRIKLELIWEKEIPEGIADVAIDKARGGLFCPTVVVTGNCENAREILFFDTLGRIERRMKLKEWSQVRISDNGKYIGIMHPEKWDGEFHYGPVEIIELSGKLVKKVGTVYGTWWWVSPKGDEVIVKDVWSDDDIYYFKGTPGKDKANLTTGEGDVTMFAGIPAIKWSGTESGYFQIGNLISNLECLPNGHTISSSGDYVAIPKAVSRNKDYVYHLLVYRNNVLLKEFALEKKGWVLSSFSPDRRFLAVAVENAVFLFDLTEKKRLWKYESDDPHQILNLGTTLDFSTDSLFYLAGVFCHYENMGSKDPAERILIFSKKGKNLLNSIISENLHRMEKIDFKVNPKGDQLCYVTNHSIRVFQLRRAQ